MRTMELPAFIEHLVRLRGGIPAAQRRGMKRAAELVKQEAQQLIGTEYEKWAPLAASTVAEKQRLGYTGRISATDPLYRTGELRATIGASWDEHHARVGSNDPIAAYQEFGTARIPARPFLGAAAFRKGADAARAAGLEVARHLAGLPHGSG